MHQPIEQPLVPVSGETPTGAAATPRASFRAPTGFAASKFLVVTASGPEISGQSALRQRIIAAAHRGVLPAFASPPSGSPQ